MTFVGGDSRPRKHQPGPDTVNSRPAAPDTVTVSSARQRILTQELPGLHLLNIKHDIKGHLYTWLWRPDEWGLPSLSIHTCYP